MTHAFISYSRKNTDFVNRLELDLHQRGILTWRDVHSIPGGAKWFRRIKQGLEAAYAMIYIDTPEAEISDWVEKEFLFGAALNLPIIPVKLDSRFMSLATINLNPVLCDEANYTVGMNKIVAQLKSLPLTPIVAGAIAPPEPPRTAEPVADTSPALDYRQEALDYLQWLLVKTHADLRDALYVNLQATPERVIKPSAASPLGFGLDVDFGMGFRRLDLERIRGEDFDKNGDDVPDARVPLNEMRRVILLGEPGAGKTTTLLQMAVDAARLAETDPNAKLPVFVPLREYDGSEPFPEFVQKRLYNLQDAYADLLRDGRLLFLLDALNEMPRTGADGRDLVDDVRDFLRDKDDWAVSCRVRDYQEELHTLESVGKIRLKPLDPPRIYEVIQRRFREQFAPAGYATTEDGEKLWQAMYGSADLLKAWDVFVACKRADAFWGKEWPDDVKPEGEKYRWNRPGYHDWERMQSDKRRMLPLCRNPYMVKMVTDLYAIDKSLPENRGALFKKFVDKLLERDRQLAEQVGAAWLDDALIRRGLAQIAYAMGRETEMARGRAETLLREHLPEADIALLLRLAQGASLLDVGENVRFTHQLLQEYFASEVLGMDIDKDVDPTTYWQPENWWQPNGREETLIILAGVRGDPEGIARWVAPAQPELAYQVLTDSGVAVDFDKLDARTRQALIASARAKVDEPDAVGRAAAYRVLGLFDADDRPGVGVKPSPLNPRPLFPSPSGRGARGEGAIPDIVWCEVPAGPFLMGSDEAEDPDARDDETPQRDVDIPYTYWMSKYPVTNAQYAPFVAGDGYTNRAYWTDAGWEQKEQERWTQPRYWDDPRWNLANHPVVGVSWYEAVAYTAWLDALMPSSPALLPQGEGRKPQRGSPLKERGSLLKEGDESLREMASRAMVYIARDLRKRQTDAETLLWECLRDRRLNNMKFRRQHPVANTAYVVDFFCYEEQLVIELDGGIHAEQVEADAKRQRELEALGLQVVRFSNDQVFNQLKGVLTSILHAAAFPFSLREKGSGDEGGRPGYVIRLPTETEWEKAARGTDGRIYPYGNTFNPQQANVLATGIGRTSAVGLFGTDDLPHSLGDMSGNVWEWCLTLWRSSYADGAEDNNPVNHDFRVARGGAFNLFDNGSRAAFRYPFHTHDVDPTQGFRLLRGVPIPSVL